MIFEGNRLEIVTQKFGTKVPSQISQNRAPKIYNGEDRAKFEFGEISLFTNSKLLFAIARHLCRDREAQQLNPSRSRGSSRERDTVFTFPFANARGQPRTRRLKSSAFRDRELPFANAKKVVTAAVDSKPTQNSTSERTLGIRSESREHKPDM